jgi:hypothetical protein
MDFDKFERENAERAAKMDAERSPEMRRIVGVVREVVGTPPRPDVPTERPETAWRVKCHCCPSGGNFLTEKEYMYQMSASDSGWVCPVTGQRGEWDDDWYDTWCDDHYPEESDDNG